jgi:hypothetical protein
VTCEGLKKFDKRFALEGTLRKQQTGARRQHLRKFRRRRCRECVLAKVERDYPWVPFFEFLKLDLRRKPTVNRHKRMKRLALHKPIRIRQLPEKAADELEREMDMAEPEHFELMACL